MQETHCNWAGNYTYRAARIHYPETLAQVQALVRRGDMLKVLGSRHSFNDIADTPGDLISLAHFDAQPVFDRERRTVTVAAGVTYGQLGPQLHEAGYALPNLASLPHISIGGACATATHGSGIGQGTLASSVSALELVTADGDVVRLSRAEHGDQFSGAVVGLGGLGVVTKLTLDLLPTFAVSQKVYENLPLPYLADHFEAIVSCAYSVSLFTDWQSASVNQVWVKRQVTDGPPVGAADEFFSATPAPAHRHPIAGLSAEPCTVQMGIPGPWYARLPHFRPEFTPSSGEELQSEYLLPRRYAVPAIDAVAGLGDHLAPLLQISEVRTIAADDLWMSPCYGRDCIAIHFTWHKNWAGVRQLLPRLEEALAPFEAVPHWGKLFTMPPLRVQAGYPKLPDFQRLLRTYDPQGKFRNAFLDRYIFGAA